MVLRVSFLPPQQEPRAKNHVHPPERGQVLHLEVPGVHRMLAGSRGGEVTMGGILGTALQGRIAPSDPLPLQLLVLLVPQLIPHLIHRVLQAEQGWFAQRESLAQALEGLDEVTVQRVEQRVRQSDAKGAAASVSRGHVRSLILRG
eukprot:765911-Hanusia_phi.AAC.2